MRVLLDTNVLIWWMIKSERLRPEWDMIISDRENTVFVSSVSAVEIGIKSSLGKLDPTPEPVASAMVTAGFHELPFTMVHGQAVADLPWHHRDPFDRMIIAQAMVEGLPVLTSDRIFRDYGLQVIGAR
jgi:PIN domain nuclease of toxin-antitoxin system